MNKDWWTCQNLGKNVNVVILRVDTVVNFSDLVLCNTSLVMTTKAQEKEKVAYIGFLQNYEWYISNDTIKKIKK